MNICMYDNISATTIAIIATFIILLVGEESSC